MAGPVPPNRPKTLREVEILARSHTELAIETLVDVMTDRDSPAAARVAASNVILDRGWGKPKQVVQMDSGMERMTDEQIQRLIAERLAALTAGVTVTGAPVPPRIGSTAGRAGAGGEEEEGPEILHGPLH